MTTIQRFQVCAIIAVAVTALTACSDKDRGSLVVKGRFQPESTQQTSMAKAVGGEDSIQSVSGATVTAAEITSTGTFRTIPGTQTTTNASGEFTLTVDVSSAQHIVVLVQSAGQQWVGHVSGEVRNGRTYVMKAVNTESTVEAEVFARLVASGKAATVTKADIEMAVSAQLAARIRGNASALASVAAALSNSAEARARFWSTHVQQSATQKLNAAMRASAQAHLAFEASMAASVNAGQREAALEALAAAMANAQVTAGLTTAQTAQMIDAMVRVHLNSLTSASTQIQDESRSMLSLIKSAAITVSVQAEAAAAGMSQATIQAITQAGSTLRATVRTGVGTSAEIQAAFNAYVQSVRSAIEADPSSEASAFIHVHAAVNSSMGAGNVFRTSVSASVDAQVVTTAYTTFVSSVKSLVEARLTGASQARIDATTRLLVLVNLC